MGTASLVFGLISIGFGILFTLVWLIVLSSSEFNVEGFYLALIVSIVLFVIGGLLLRKFDKDRKKEKNS